MEKFEKLGIEKPILDSIKEQRFEEPSEIQEKAIPLVLAGKDVIAGSATGSGKTLAFGSGIIQNSQRGSGIKALVLTPTRELAEQVAMALRQFAKYKPLNIVTVYGGVSIEPQIRNLKRADVVVATPGRVIDHMERRTIDFSKVRILVLDEADRMLDMGFIDHVKQIVSSCPRERQTLLFSATITDEVSFLSKKYMKNPEKVAVDSYVDPSKLKQVYYDVSDNLKFSLLVHLLKNERTGLVMVFCNTKMNTDFVANNLKAEDVDAIAIHGGFSQNKRTNTLRAFNSQKAHVLVCTDVAARGLDIKGVSHVYNYDIPKESNQYIHRIGRTARAGEDGKAINILANRDYDNFSRVLRDNNCEISKEETPNVAKIFIKWKPSPRGRRDFRGSRNFRGGGGGRDHKGSTGSSYRGERSSSYRGGASRSSSHRGGSSSYRGGASRSSSHRSGGGPRRSNNGSRR